MQFFEALAEFGLGGGDGGAPFAVFAFGPGDGGGLFGLEALEFGLVGGGDLFAGGLFGLEFVLECDDPLLGGLQAFVRGLRPGVGGFEFRESLIVRSD